MYIKWTGSILVQEFYYNETLSILHDTDMMEWYWFAYLITNSFTVARASNFDIPLEFPWVNHVMW